MEQSIRVVGGDLLGKALVLRQNLLRQGVSKSVQKQNTLNSCVARGIPEVNQGLDAPNLEYRKDGPADTEPSVKEERATQSGTNSRVCTELSEHVLGGGPAGIGTDTDMSDSDLLVIFRQCNEEGVNPSVADPDTTVLLVDNLLRMERRIASLENELVKQREFNERLEIRLSDLENVHKTRVEGDRNGGGVLPRLEPSILLNQGTASLDSSVPNDIRSKNVLSGKTPACGVLEQIVRRFTKEEVRR